jgi:SlyX protein
MEADAVQVSCPCRNFWRTRVTTEDRLIEMEIKIARQEDMVEALNQLVYQQQRKTDQLEALCSALARRLRDISSAGNELGAADERPPHY